MPARLLFANCLHSADADVGQALGFASNVRESTFAQVNDAARHVRPVIINPNRNAFAIALISNFYHGAERKGTMGGRQAISIETFTIGRCAPVEAGAVVASDAA